MRRIGFGVVLVGAVALAACGSSGYGGSDSTSSTTKAAAGAAGAGRYGDGTSSSTGAEASGAEAVSVRMTSLGNVITDAAGRTLYLYQPDGTSTTSKVPASLLTAWPPLMATDAAPEAGAGVDQAKLTVAAQPDGARWIAYHGHLLYTFSGDQAAGDTNGQALGNVWYAVSPDGSAITS